MQCERCKNNVATVHLTEIVKSQKTEKHLCEQCAKEEGYTIKTHVSLQDLLTAFISAHDDAEEMASWEHGGGFSLDASVRIETNDRSGLERLLRYCARPVFALERLRQIDAEHRVYESVKPGPGGSVSLLLTPLELIERLAALIPVLSLSKGRRRVGIATTASWRRMRRYGRR